MRTPVYCRLVWRGEASEVVWSCGLCPSLVRSDNDRFQWSPGAPGIGGLLGVEPTQLVVECCVKAAPWEYTRISPGPQNHCLCWMHGEASPLNSAVWAAGPLTGSRWLLHSWSGELWMCESRF